MSSRPHTTSARQRAPLTGRSNISDASARSTLYSNRSYQSVQSNSNAAFQVSVDPKDKKSLNDPLVIFRPFSSEMRVSDQYKYNPPILPRTVTDPLLAKIEPIKERRRRPISCPQEWIDKTTKPELLERSAFTSDVSPDQRRTICRGFVERNRDRLWKYDLKFAKQTPRTICEEMEKDEYFVANMSKRLSRERVVRLSSAENTVECLTDKNEYPPLPDPFRSSLRTTREERDARMTKLLAPARLQHGTQYQRGYNHAIDFGNFSKYNAVLKKNAATTMNR